VHVSAAPPGRTSSRKRGGASSAAAAGTAPALADLDDPSLVALCREDDERAWQTLVRRYRSLVYSAALRTGLDQESAGDVFQLVWVELHRSLDRLRDGQALPRWLVVTTRRIAYKHALRNDRPIDGALDELVDPAALADDELQSLQTLQHLQHLVAGLGGTCARLLALLFLDDRRPDYREVARRAGISIGSIGPLRARCLERLRKELEASS
jgi:RNA polymerase sigma factor (sigma-70 family)